MTTAKGKNAVQGHVEAALAALRKQEWPEQCRTIEDLAASVDAPADMILLHLLEGRTANFREVAMQTLAERSQVLGRIAARALLDDADECVRNAAATLLGQIGARLDVRRLRHALNDTSWVMRATVTDSLGLIGGVSAHPYLKQAMLNDPHPVVRRDAAFALWYARSRDVVPDLERALREEKGEQAQVGISEALYALGKTDYLASLLTHLHSEDYQVRYATAHSLAEITRPDDRSQVIEALRAMLLREHNPGLQIDGARIIEELSSSDTSTRDE